MNKLYIYLIFVFIIIIAVMGYLAYLANKPTTYNKIPQTQNEQPPAEQTQNQQPTQPETLTASILIKNFAFNPATLNIKVGTTVTWTNNDAAPHQIKSDGFSSSSLNTGSTFQFTFSNAGTYNYFCAIHPSMRGQINVTQ